MNQGFCMNAEIDLPGYGVVDVDYTAEPFVPAQITGRDSDHPAEGGEIEIDSVTDENGNDIGENLTDKEWEYITDKLEYYND